MALLSWRRSGWLVCSALLLSGCIKDLDAGGNGGSGGAGATGGQAGTGGQGTTGGQAGSDVLGGQGGSGATGEQAGTGGQGGSGATGGQAGTGGQGGSGSQQITGWSRHYDADPGYDYVVAMTVAPDQSVIIVGNMSEPTDFGGGPLDGGIYMAKIDPDGNLVWARTFGSVQGEAAVSSVDLDPNGNIFMGGFVREQIDFGNGVVVGDGGSDYDALVAKLDPNGAVIWAKAYGGDQDESAKVAADAQGNVFVTGDMLGTIDLGNGPLTNTAGGGKNEQFVGKIDGNGSTLWSRKFGAVMPGEFTGWVESRHIKADGLGDVILGGHFQGEVDFGGPTTLKTISQTLYFVKLDASGGIVWQKAFATDNKGYMANYGMGVSPSGELVFSGVFGGTIDFGGGPVSGIDWNNGSKVAVKLDAAGNHVYTRAFDIDSFVFPQMCEIADVAMNPDGSAALIGSYEGKLDLTDLGGPTFVSPSGNGTFVIRLDTAGQLVTAQNSYTSFYPVLTLGEPDGAGGLYVAGWYKGDLDVGFGIMPSGADIDTALARFIY